MNLIQEESDEGEDMFDGDSEEEAEAKPYTGKKTEVTTGLVKKWKILLQKKK